MKSQYRGNLEAADGAGDRGSVKGVICFAAVDWHFLRQRPHHLMTTLAGLGLKVLFIENTGVRFPHLGDIDRVGKRLKNAFKFKWQKQTDSETVGLEVYAPLVIPLPFNRGVEWYNEGVLQQRISIFLKRNHLRPENVVIWTYLATPVVMEIAKTMPWHGVVYDVVSDPKEIEPRLEPFELGLLQRANYVLFASATLREQYQEQTRNPVLFRDGFNVELREGSCQAPSSIAALPRPRLLYTGGINRKVWTEALGALSSSLPEASIILLGPLSPQEAALPVADNIYHLPPCSSYQDLAGYLCAADVALVPYRLDRYAGAMHPAKLNEYMVFGLPIVATATPELRRLAAEWPEHTFYFADHVDDYAQAVLKALAEDSPERRQKRSAFTANNTWKNKASELLYMLDSRKGHEVHHG
jgi:glycosyltransferase involved in cell wall biosynthesis